MGGGVRRGGVCDLRANERPKKIGEGTYIYIYKHMHGYSALLTNSALLVKIKKSIQNNDYILYQTRYAKYRKKININTK